MEKFWKEKIEYSCAVICIISAISIGIASIIITEKHDIASGILIYIAQLLIFAASVFHINYKLNMYGEANQKSDNK